VVAWVYLDKMALKEKGLTPNCLAKELEKKMKKEKKKTKEKLKQAGYFV
jgi:hypothetical protein